MQAQGNVCLGILDASGASLEVTNIIGGMFQCPSKFCNCKYVYCWVIIVHDLYNEAICSILDARIYRDMLSSGESCLVLQLKQILGINLRNMTLLIKMLINTLLSISDISMRGYLIVYDNVRQQIGWIRRNCHIRPTRTSSQVLTQVASLFN